MGIIPIHAEVRLESDSSQPGIRFEWGSMQWSVRPERLAVESKDPNVDCGQPVAALLRHLAWTPLNAVGVNSHFVGDGDIEANLPNEFALPASQKYLPFQRTCHLSTRIEESVFNLQLSVTEKDLDEPQQCELTLNVHTDLAGKKTHQPQIEVNQMAQTLCHSYPEQRRKAEELARSVFEREEFSYEIHDAE